MDDEDDFTMLSNAKLVSLYYQYQIPLPTGAGKGGNLRRIDLVRDKDTFLNETRVYSHKIEGERAFIQNMPPDIILNMLKLLEERDRVAFGLVSKGMYAIYAKAYPKLRAEPVSEEKSVPVEKKRNPRHKKVVEHVYDEPKHRHRGNQYELLQDLVTG